MILFDGIRNVISIEPEIKQSLENQQNIGGIFCDGKLIFSVDLDQFRAIATPSDQDPEQDLARLLYFTTTALERASERGYQRSIPELFSRLAATFQTRQPAHAV